MTTYYTVKEQYEHVKNVFDVEELRHEMLFDMTRTLSEFVLLYAFDKDTTVHLLQTLDGDDDDVEQVAAEISEFRERNPAEKQLPEVNERIGMLEAWVARQRIKNICSKHVFSAENDKGAQ